MSKFIQAKSYLQYLLKGKKHHGVHSPFVYELLDEVIYKVPSDEKLKQIEDLRASLLKDGRSIQITDLGAGSTVNSSRERKIKDIARNSAKPQKYCQVLFNLAQRFKSKNILELGTSLGISSSYLSAANPNSKLTTIEGCPETAKAASENFDNLGLKNIDLLRGNFDEVLPEYLNNSTDLDLVFIDGNHRKEPTINYFEQCLSKSNEHSIFVFDDIHWSHGMEEAWEYVKQHKSVTVSIDLYFIGIVFLKPEQAKQDFVIRF